ncbi:MAG: zf-HC2 domain-containing protein [Planctomycetes bacterium]|nr:zf-HC2 domain-containing protein [Planctomycetota bacterium]
MKTQNDNPCRAVRQKLSAALDLMLNRAFGSFLRSHIEHCPRCSRRLMSLHRVELAIQLTKSQAHSLDLLSRANTAALCMLKHSLRFAPKAEKLRAANPEPGWTTRHSFILEKGFSVAACLMVLVLIKCGSTAFLKDVRRDGTKVMYNYYTKNLGQDVANDLMES